MTACTDDCIALAGVVEDVWGTPLANATVRGEGGQAITDAAGTFTIEVDRADERTIEIRADAEGYSARTRRVSEGPLMFRLPPEATVSGRAIDAATGAPVPHATVSAGEASTTADANGRFSFAVDAPAYHLAAITPSRRGEASVTIGIGDHEEDVEIEMTARINVVARIEQVGPRACPEQLHFATGVLEGDRFRMEMTPGHHVVDVGCGQQETVFVGDSDLELTWRIGVGGTVRGRVALASRAALAAALVTLEQVDARRSSSGWKHLEDDGTFAFADVAPGRYRVRVALGDRSEEVTPAFDLAHGEVVERTFEMAVPPLRSVRGSVRLDGRAVANLGIELAGSVLHTRSDGTFKTELPEGNYMMHVNIPGMTMSEYVAVGAGGAQRELSYTSWSPEPPRPLRRFEGRVLEENAQLLPGALVTCRDTDSVVVADETGRFHCESRLDSARVEVHRMGGGSTTGWLVAGRITELRLYRPISGQVFAADGRAGKSAIEIKYASGAKKHAVTQSDGRFQIPYDGTPATIVAMLAGQEGANTITLDERTPRTGLVLRLRSAVTVRGRIIDGVTQEPVAGVQIHARPGVAGWANWFTNASQTTDANGVFVIEDVPPGTLLLQILPPSTTWSDQSITIDVPASSGDIGTFTLARVGRR